VTFPFRRGCFSGWGSAAFSTGSCCIRSCNGITCRPARAIRRTICRTLNSNIVWNGIFHASTYLFVAIGLSILWRAARKQHIQWSGKLLPASILIGFGIFNLVEGIADHHLLGLHHVNETVPREQWIWAR